MVWTLKDILTCTFLIAKDTEYRFKYLVAIYISAFENVQFINLFIDWMIWFRAFDF